jgi:8-oxo-dGTP pyrophosphatase MutT (NUDIX family)
MVEPAYKGDWEIPGGTVEADESPHSAACREIKEELGLSRPVGGLVVMDGPVKQGNGIDVADIVEIVGGWRMPER